MNDEQKADLIAILGAWGVVAFLAWCYLRSSAEPVPYDARKPGVHHRQCPHCEGNVMVLETWNAGAVLIRAGERMSRKDPVAIAGET